MNLVHYYFVLTLILFAPSSIISSCERFWRPSILEILFDTRNNFLTFVKHPKFSIVLIKLKDKSKVLKKIHKKHKLTWFDTRIILLDNLFFLQHLSHVHWSKRNKIWPVLVIHSIIVLYSQFWHNQNLNNCRLTVLIGNQSILGGWLSPPPLLPHPPLNEIRPGCP